MVARTVWLCPGQGAQKVGMGKDVAERFPAAHAVLAAIDEALGFGLSELMFRGPETALLPTEVAQPAILAHTVAVFAALADAVGPAAAAAGHSLGEYSAYVTAGALEAPEAARLVRARGTLMQHAAAARPGTMCAVLGLPGSAVEDVCRAASEGGDLVVAANFNAPDQTVISGTRPAVERAARGCTAAGAKRVIALKVSGAFHSPLMAPAEAGLGPVLAAGAWREPRFPVVANATAEPVTAAARARALLVTQVTAPVRWVASVEQAARLAGEDRRFLEIGPGTVLCGLVKRILPDARVTSLGTADELERFLSAA